MKSEPRVLGYRSSPYRGQRAKLKSPIILLRGLSRSSGFWLEFPEHLSQYGDVHMLDLLGTGRSPDALGRASIADFAADVLLTLERAAFLPCHLVGISMGGMVALQCAGGDPAAAEKFSSLAVLASSSRGFGLQRIALPALVRMLGSVRGGRPRHAAFAEYLVCAETLRARPELAACWDRLWEEEGFVPRAVVRQLWAAATFNARPLLGSLRMPTLFMASAQDRLVPAANTEKLWQLVPGAELRMLQGYGHDFPTDDPAGTAEELARFWAKAEAEAGRF